MNESNKESKLRTMLLDGVENKDKGASYYRRRAVFARLSTITVAGAITVVAGLKGIDLLTGSVVANVVLVMGAYLTAVNGWNEFWRNPDLWLSNTQSANELKALKAELDYRASQGSVESADIDAYFERYQMIMSGSNESWIGMRVNGVIDKKQTET